MAEPVTTPEGAGPADDLHRAAGVMILVRWCAVPWMLLQIVAYEVPYPAGYRQLAFGLVAMLVAGNAILHVAHRRDTGASARTIGLIGLGLDVFELVAFVWLYSFDYQTQIWAVLLIAPLEGAILFQLTGALSAWVVIAAAYAIRDVWAADRYGNPLLWNSITFRMGLGGIIALVAGLMARDLLRQKTKVADTLEEIRRIDRLRSGLVSTLGHDVRSPLTVIRGVIGTLLTHGDKVSPADRTELLGSADRQARRLEDLANGLLDLARLDEGRLEFDTEPVGVEEAVRTSLSYVEGGDAFGVSIDADLVVRADPRRLEQVIVNLASNALRHGEPPVSITGRAEGDMVLIQVADRGPGVPEAELDQLFEPFNADRKPGSVGYGLAIVRALVEAQHGRVSYEPAEGGGTVFTIALPRDAKDDDT